MLRLEYYLQVNFPPVFQKSRNNLNILVASMVTWNKIHTEGPKNIRHRRTKFNFLVELVHGVRTLSAKGTGPVSRCSYIRFWFVNTRTKVVYFVRYNISTINCQNYFWGGGFESFSVWDDVQFGNILAAFQGKLSTLPSLVYSEGEGNRALQKFVNFRQTTRSHITKYWKLLSHCIENFRFHVVGCGCCSFYLPIFPNLRAKKS